MPFRAPATYETNKPSHIAATLSHLIDVKECSSSTQSFHHFYLRNGNELLVVQSEDFLLMVLVLVEAGCLPIFLSRFLRFLDKLDFRL
jgi:hypothetical protein